MDMDGCEKCEGTKMNKCEVFKVYTDLCIAMPYMSQCRDYRTMCSWDPSLPFCDPELSVNGPAMKMYFHWGIKDYVLFQSWVPFSSFSYFLACLFCFLTGIGYEYLLYFNQSLEAKWRHKEEEIRLPQPDTISLQESNGPRTPPHPVMEEDSPLMNVYPDQSQKSYWSPFSIRLCRSALRFVTIGAATNLANQQKIISEHYIALASFTDPLVKVTGISDIKAQFRALTYFKKITVKKHSITTSSLNDAEVVVIDATISYNIFWMFYLHVRTVTKFEFAASGLIRRQEDLWSIADMVGALPL
ncbi:hypothetical protein HK103_000581 [Boothiomyces macroporosus]|uniref:Copper transport protein n=1 Tax=Boothiomyces macroporosus TaxID=261099 RepID=A0AAD5UKC4_9FUNG|nr:hypothetical protein HK103_000581 [Boothiomyces macroporosus]